MVKNNAADQRRAMISEIRHGASQRQVAKNMVIIFRPFNIG